MHFNYHIYYCTVSTRSTYTVSPSGSPVPSSRYDRISFLPACNTYASKSKKHYKKFGINESQVGPKSETT